MDIKTYNKLKNLKDGTRVTLAYVQKGLSVCRMRGQLSPPTTLSQCFKVFGPQGNAGLILPTDDVSLSRDGRKYHIRVNLQGVRIQAKSKWDPDVAKEINKLFNLEA